MKSNSNCEQPAKYVKVLTIAGSDSSGGAGIQADLKTFSAHGCYGMTVITALTAQNTQGVTGIHPVPPEFVKQQLIAVLSDIGVDAVKIGMLYSTELIETIASTLSKFKVKKIVLDPVMIAQSGDKLLQNDSIEAIKQVLIPQVDLITPNLPEAAVLVNRKIDTIEEIHDALIELSKLNCKNILIKGGHLTGNTSNDYLYLSEEKRVVEFEGKRIETRNNHGTGCTLSSAIASNLAKGNSLIDSVSNSKKYIEGAIKSGASYLIGKGHGPVNHFFDLWNN